jgi:hypothetical protein
MLDGLAARIVAGGPPGARGAVRVVEPDGASLTLVTAGDAVDVHLALPGRRELVQHSLSAHHAAALARWLLRWWVWGTWCGLRLLLWAWAARRWNEAHAAQSPPGVVRIDFHPPKKAVDKLG